MADLTNLQGSTPVELINETSGNSATVNADGSLNVANSGVTTTPQVYSSSVSKSAVGATELMVMYVKNPNASGKTAYLKSVIVTNTHTVAGSWIRWRMYSNPTSSADGTGIAETPFGVGSGNTAVVTAFNTPTVSANGGLMLDMVALAGQTEQYDFPAGTYISPNNNVLFTAVADGTSRVGQVTLVWAEL